jgi:NAD(P)-dependent dehydrogenase (short-subunit alcohol dehydrogenase family)
MILASGSCPSDGRDVRADTLRAHRRDLSMNQPLANRIAIVTGASQGLGLEIARAYLQAGARVMMCARDAALIDRRREELSGITGPDCVAAMGADVSHESDVTRLVETTLATFGGVHVLVNNAGVYGPMGVIEDVDWDAWVRAIEINICGSVLPCRAVVPHFRRQRYGKIVQVSGGGATNPLPRISAYAASKAAVVRFAETLALEVRDDGIDVNAIAPGALNTRMLDEVLAAGPATVGQEFFDRMVKTKAQGGTPLETGAALAVFLGSAESDGITGRLISAVWDPWSDLPSRREDLNQSDVYTLRRILPKDRGLTWGEP